MSAAVMEEEADLVIETAEDLFNVLRSSDYVMRIAVLRQISAEPEAALSFGKFHDYDVVDELVHQGYQQCSVTYLKALMVALAAFVQDLRALEFLKKVFMGSRQPDIVSLASKLFANLADLGHTLPVMRHLLTQDESEMHARAAAHVLAHYREEKERPATERVRLLLLIPPHVTIEPPLRTADLQYREDWLRELDGPYRIEARLCLEALGEPAVSVLAESWHELSEESQLWMLGWGVGVAPQRLLPRMEQVLFEDAPVVTVQVQVKAVGALSQLKPAALKRLRPKLTRFLSPTADPALRHAALRAGAPAPPECLREMIAEDQNRAVTLAAIERLAQTDPEGAVPDMLSLLQAEEWDLRAAAADALAGLPQSAVVEQVRSLVFHGDMAVRAAAANVLIAQGDDEWLEETLLV